MKKPRLLALVLCLAVTAQVAHAADTPSAILDVSIANGARLQQHWHDSIYSKVWNSPALAPLRAKLDEVTPQAQEEMGFDPFSVLSSLASVHLQVFPHAVKSPLDTGTEADLLIQADFGSNAAVIFKGLSSKGTPATVPGADEAVQLAGENEQVVARFGNVLMSGPKTATFKPKPIPASEHDIALRLDGQALAVEIRGVAPAEDLPKVEAVLTILAPYLVRFQADLDVVPDGLRAQGSAPTSFSWLKPVDHGWLAHLPATAYSCGGLGIDGQALWKDLIHPLLVANGGQAEEQFNAGARNAGLDVGLADMVNGLKGTIFAASSPGAPFPGFTIGIPRSPALDKLVAFGLKQLQAEAPAEGGSTVLAIPNLPLPINLIRSADAWVVTTDQSIVTGWSTPANAWATTPLGKLTLGKLDADVCMFSVSDTPTELRTLQGYLGLGLGAVPLEAAQKQAILNGMAQLIAQSGMAFQFMRQKGNLVTSEGRGLLAVGSSSVAVAGGAMVAAIAIPNLLESKVASAEMAAAASLKSKVFPAEIHFQGGGYHDRDKDGIGDFGFFAEMAGAPIAGQADKKLTLSLLPAAWNAVNPLVNGYRFAIYIPDGKDGALSADQDHALVKVAGGQSPGSAFVAYAWPDSPDQGRRVFALNAAGVVFSAPFKAGDQPPAWNALFGGKDWKATPVWQPYRRGGHRDKGAPGQITPADDLSF